jgi:heme exporter protein B
VLVSLLVLPLCIPVLIFGAGAVEAVNSGMSVASNLAFLGAFLLFALVFTPFVAAQALRISME